MTRALAPVLIRSDDLDAEEFQEVVAQWQRLGGKSKICADLIAERIAARPDARLARRDAALADLASHYQGSNRARAQAMAGALRRYETTGTQAHAVGKGAALFAVLKNSPASGAPREKTIRDVLGRIPGLSLAHASPQNANQSEEAA